MPDEGIARSRVVLGAVTAVVLVIGTIGQLTSWFGTGSRRPGAATTTERRTTTVTRVTPVLGGYGVASPVTPPADAAGARLRFLHSAGAVDELIAAIRRAAGGQLSRVEVETLVDEFAALDQAHDLTDARVLELLRRHGVDGVAAQRVLTVVRMALAELRPMPLTAPSSPRG